MSAHVCYVSEGQVAGPVPWAAFSDDSFITVAFSDAAVSDPRGKVEGKLQPYDLGTSVADLEACQADWNALDRTSKLIRLDLECARGLSAADAAELRAAPGWEPAAVLVLKRYAPHALQDPDGARKLYGEVANAKWDQKSKAKAESKLINDSLARFRAVWVGGQSFDPTPRDKFEGKGVINDEDDYPLMRAVRLHGNAELTRGHEAAVCSANLYLTARMGIRPHGDGERRRNRILRLGPGSRKRPLRFVLYYRRRPYAVFDVDLDDGDMLIFSGKALGYDFMKSSIVTYRHTTGSDYYTKLNDTPEEKAAKKRARESRKRAREL